MCGSLLTRRLFMQMTASATVVLGGQMFLPSLSYAAPASGKRYKGPNVIVIRYGGGVRRRETIDPEHSFSPFLLHRLIPKGTLYSNMSIADIPENETSHAQGTINIMTGRYLAYNTAESRTPGEALKPTVPTMFEYFRSAYALLPHECLIINGEDQISDDGFHMNLHKNYGVAYRSELLSPNRFQAFMLQLKLEEEEMDAKKREALLKQLEDLKKRTPEFLHPQEYHPQIRKFWRKWRAYYGDDNLKQPRGDRQTTELSLWAMRYLRPKLMLVNYQDTDFVHWGVKSHYTRAISVIDQGIQSLVTSVEADPFYKDNTIFVIVPDCGRDDNPLMDVPFQHHFNSPSTREIFALLYGPGIQKNTIIKKPTDQSAIVSTVGALMGFKTKMSEGTALEEALT